MSHVFFSYCHQNTELAGKVVNSLQKNGFAVWQDVSSIRGGSDWNDAIQNGLADAGAVVVLWTVEAAASEWVKKEIRLADAAKKLIIPLQVDNTPLNADLAPKQAIPLHSGESGINRALTQLIEALPADLRRRRAGFQMDVPLGQQPIAKRLDAEGTPLVWVPLIESSYCKAFVVGKPETVVSSPRRIQLCLQFTKTVNYPFVPQVYEWFCKNQEPGDAADFIGLCVTGPVDKVSQEYHLSNDNSAHWGDAVGTTYDAVMALSETRKPMLQVFSQAAVPLAFALGTRFWRFWHIQLYNWVNQTYKLVIEILPDGG
jgi:hypothetical protein